MVGGIPLMTSLHALVFHLRFFDINVLTVFIGKPNDISTEYFMPFISLY